MANIHTTTWRALLYTDVHYKFKAPQSRLDNYGEAILRKMGWIRDFGNEKEVDFFWDSGDLYDLALQSPLEIYLMFQALSGRKAPTKAVAGNHPIKGNVDAWKPHSGLYLLEKMFEPGYFEILDGFEATIEMGGRSFKMHHTDLVREPVIWDHVLWEDYKTDADVVLISHYHPQQGIERVNDHWFVSPGAVSRGSLGEDNVSRIPAVALIEVNPRGKIKMSLHNIPCEPGEKVLNTSTVLKVQDVALNLEQYQKSVTQLQVLRNNPDKTLSPEDIVRSVGAGLSIGPRSLELALDTIRGLRKG